MRVSVDLLDYFFLIFAMGEYLDIAMIWYEHIEFELQYVDI